MDTGPRELSRLLWSMAMAVAIATAVGWVGMRMSTPYAVASFRPPTHVPIFVELHPPSGPAAVFRLQSGATTADLLSLAGLPLPADATPVPCRSGDSWRVLPDGTLEAGRMPGERMVALGIRIPINEASAADLAAIPGVGQAVADRIVTRRAAMGQFDSYEDVDDVEGVGEQTLRAIQRHTTF